MREALKLARASQVLPYPNPWVGSVIVKNGKIVGRGCHRGPGTNHAEVEAIRQAGSRAEGATLYVTLEPCCHHGNTPPCTDAIRRAGIRRVFYAVRDPNPQVAGRGARILKSNGVEVRAGLCSRQAKEINEVYLKFRATSLPFVTAKAATTLDGKISTRTGESKWITDKIARRRARMLRAEHQAVMVGINTVLRDDPHLGVRLRGRPDPWRVVLDSSLRIPSKSQVVQSGQCIVACASRASARRIARLERRGATIWRFKGRRVPLRALLAKLADKGINSILVEGGAEVLGSFFDEGLVDRVCWFVSPVIVGSTDSRAAVAGRGAAKLAAAWRLRDYRFERVGDSSLLQGNLSRWAVGDPSN
ncbi:MAG: bifunctional diaminohydroxyphosphoribosylaminopyrimidine deaminase/5-amino-6-(5-phosphoribosylamino)uracil reductase RibD [Deltaproteobacteria bacterium]